MCTYLILVNYSEHQGKGNMQNMAAENSDLHQNDHWIYLYFLLYNKVCSSSFLETNWGRHVCCAYFSALLSCYVQLVGPHMICSMSHDWEKNVMRDLKWINAKFCVPHRKLGTFFFPGLFFPQTQPISKVNLLFANLSYLTNFGPIMS